MKGQVWIETTLYTLIGLALIGMVLAFATPKITAIQEKTMIEQTISSLQDFDKIVFDISTQGPGNRRTYEIKFKKGDLIFNVLNNTITFKFENLASEYSQVNSTINMGAVDILTLAKQKKYDVYLTLNYSNTVQITVNGKNSSKEYFGSPTPYKLIVSNNGFIGSPSKSLIDISEV
ncbi:MAG: hypothetical protein AABX66_04080 [Nanoarchaeota archaeon]